MKNNLIFILLFVIYISVLVACIDEQNGSGYGTTELSGTKVTKSFDEMETGELLWEGFKVFLNGSRDTVIDGVVFLIDSNGCLYDEYKTVCVIDNPLGIALGNEAAAINTGSKVIKLIGTIDDASLGIIKNCKWIEISTENFNFLQKIFRVKKINKGWYAIHGFERMVQRGISYEKLCSLVKKPYIVSSASYGRKMYMARDGLTAIVQDGKVVTCYYPY